MMQLDCLATGHNLDDEAQSITMNIFRNDINSLQRQGPITGIVKDKKFVQRVKPLYFIREKEVERYSKLMDFPVNYGRCPCSTDAFRREFRDGLTELEASYPNTKESIIEFFIKNIYSTKKIKKHITINSCSLCGEPSRDTVCRACQIIGMLRTAN
jgi:uncharacterized protein (TIGR00269 family)